MVVKPQTKGRAVTGLLVGARNVTRFFPRGISSVVLQLDHLQIQCDLSAEFWADRPEIHDRRLCAWLEAKHYHALPGEEPFALALVPAGGNSFRLRVVGLHRHSHA